MNRRSFITGLAGILASGVSPIILPSTSIMRVRPVIPILQDGNGMRFYINGILDGVRSERFVGFVQQDNLKIPSTTRLPILQVKAGEVVEGCRFEYVHNGIILLEGSEKKMEHFPCGGTYTIDAIVTVD